MTWPAEYPIYFGRRIPGQFGNQPAPTSSILVYDTFTGADGTNLTAHTPDVKPTGSVWTSLSGVVQISSNKAIWISGSPCIYWIEIGKSDCGISCITTFLGNSNAGIAFRVEGANDWWLASISAGHAYLLKRNPALVIVSDTAEVRTAGVQYALDLTISADSIVFKVDGVQKASVTDSFNQTITKMGLFVDGTGGGSFDNFQVVG